MHECHICQKRLVGFIEFACSGCLDKFEPEDKKKFLIQKKMHLVIRFSIAFLLLIGAILLIYYSYIEDSSFFFLLGFLLFLTCGIWVQLIGRKNFKIFDKYKKITQPTQRITSQIPGPRAVDANISPLLKAMMNSLQGQSPSSKNVSSQNQTSAPIDKNAAQILNAMKGVIDSKSASFRREPTMKNDGSIYQQVLHGILPLGEAGKLITIERPYFVHIFGAICTKASMKDMEMIGIQLSLMVGEPMQIKGGTMHLLRDTLENFLTNEREVFIMMGRNSHKDLTNIHNPKNLPFDESKLLDYSERLLEFMKSNGGFYTEDRWNR